MRESRNRRTRDQTGRGRWALGSWWAPKSRCQHTTLLLPSAFYTMEEKEGDLKNINHVSRAHAITFWRPPVDGFVKMNIDGAYKSAANTAAGGGVIRSHSGLWLYGFCFKFVASSAAAAELLVLRYGLVKAWDQKIKKLEVEVDAQSILDLLRKPTSGTVHELGAVVNDVLNLLQRDWVINLLHTKRDANMVAHALGQLALDMKDNEQEFHSPPAVAIEAYETDLLGVNM